MVQPDIKLFTERDYVAPTVYSIGTRYISSWNYYSTLQKAIDKYKYIHNLGGSDSVEAGFVKFVNNNTNQTFGINCDFYILYDNVWQLTSYEYLKYIGVSKFPPMVFRFLLPTGAGPYYAVFEPYYFGLSAQSIKTVPPEKLAQLDEFYRAVDLMKFRYNALVGFLNAMGKRELNTVEQQVFNEGMLILNSFNQQIATIRGLEISYSQTGAMGLPIILIIAVIAILSAATAWTISTIVTEKEKTKQIAASYDFNKWIADKKIDVARLAEQGQISKQSADSINATLNDAAGIANKVAANAAKNGKGIFDNLSSIAMWLAIGAVGYGIIKSKKSSNAA